MAQVGEEESPTAMSYTIHEDEHGKLFLVTFAGVLTDEILLESLERTAHFVEAVGIRSSVADFSAVTRFDVTAEMVARIAAREPIVPDPFLRIVVAPRDDVYGMSRMFQLRSGESSNRVTLVRTLAEAWQLLGIKEPHLVPITQK